MGILFPINEEFLKEEGKDFGTVETFRYPLQWSICIKVILLLSLLSNILKTKLLG